MKRDLPKVVPPWTVLSTDTHVRIGIVEDCCVKTLVTIDRNLDATVTQNQIPVSGHFTFKNEKVWSVLADIHSIETCKGETAEELQNFAPLPLPDSAYYRHVVCTFAHGKMRHSSTVRSSGCLGRTVCVQSARKLECCFEGRMNAAFKVSIDDCPPQLPSRGLRRSVSSLLSEIPRVSEATNEGQGHHHEEAVNRMCARQ